LFSQEEEKRKLVQKLKDSTRIRKKLEKDQTELRRQHTFLENEKFSIEKELSILRENRGIFKVEAENQQLWDKLENLSKKIGHYQQSIEDLRCQNNNLLSKFESQREMNDHFKKETKEIFTQFSTLTRCDAKCPLFDLCRKRILIVGGITKIKDRYKKLIEENGGIFEYHDGYLKGGSKILKSQVRRADMVLCPVSCNSHNACLAVKKIGKKYSKQVHMLAGSGLSAISQALRTAEIN